ncbi:MAG: lysophospholipase [Alphaproteobacteria bacterium]|nr:MAG: lysophospholipase [Alphaproteobacteria bacterium]
MTVHILKLCVGIDSIEHLAEVRKGRQNFLPDGTAYNYHITRFRPKRAGEILRGGSIYWVIKGFVQVRQQIIALEAVKTDTGMKCKIIMDTKLVRTESQPRRPHQGWRYLETADVPRDIPDGESRDNLPPDLSTKLREMGLI